MRMRTQTAKLFVRTHTLRPDWRVDYQLILVTKNVVMCAHGVPLEVVGNNDPRYMLPCVPIVVHNRIRLIGTDRHVTKPARAGFVRFW